jgi:opacity protein-like surface antigen
MAHKIRKWIASALIFSSVATSYATTPGAYFGLNLGYSNLNNNSRAVPAFGSSTITNPDGSTRPSPAGRVVSPNNTGMAGRIFLGDIITPYFGIEFGLAHYAGSSYKSPTGDTGSIHTSAFDLEGIGMYPFGTSGITVFGKLGFGYLRAVQSRKLTTQGDSANNSGLHPLIGIGVSYDLTPNWVFDLSGTRIISRSKALPSPNFVALGISYHWVDKYCGQFLC